MVRVCKRLQAVMALVPEGVPVADVGCDHGQLACALLERGTPWVAASDISVLSLDKARILGEELGFTERLHLRVCDGLAGLEPEIGAIVIAGLSAHTIEAILRAEPEKARKAGCLILQPMQDAEGLRRALTADSYTIDAEDMVYENRRYYPILRAVPGQASYTKDELDFGPKLLAEKHPLMQNYLLWRIRVVQRASWELTGNRRTEMDKEIVRLEAIRQSLKQRL